MARIEKREGWKVWLKDELIPIDVKTVQQAHEIEVAMKKIQDGELKDTQIEFDFHENNDE